MFESEDKRHKSRVEAVVQLTDGSEITGVFFVTPQARITDLLNGSRMFLPIETTSGAIVVVGKSAILRVTPVKQDKSLDSPDPYGLLGIKSSVTQEELRKAYHGLVRQYHPDHLSGLGLPQPFLEFATGQTARINDAYQKICQEKGIAAESERKATVGG